MYCSPAAYHFIPFRSKHSPQHPVKLCTTSQNWERSFVYRDNFTFTDEYGMLWLEQIGVVSSADNHVIVRQLLDSVLNLWY
jgi:hypothetical protein